MKPLASNQKALLGALLLTLAATAWLASQEEADPIDTVETVSKPRVQVAKVDKQNSAEALPLLGQDHPPALDAASVADLFKSRIVSARQAALAQAAEAQVAEPPPAPEAPPLPFSYLGQVNENGKTVYFLARDQRLYTVHAGDQLDAQYRLEDANPQRLEFIYLPLNIKQTLLMTGAS